MATKKQKHARALERREAFMEELHRSNQEALKKSREARLKRRKEKAQPVHDEKHSWKKRDLDCILCVEEIKETERRALELAREIEEGEVISA